MTSQTTYRVDSAAVAERLEMCHRIARQLWSAGYQADPMTVNRKYVWFKMWYGGMLDSEFMEKATGIQRRKVR